MSRFRNAAKAVFVAPMRRGNRTVVWTPEFMGVGNLLFVLQWADHMRRRGQDVRVLKTPRLEQWLGYLPELRELVIDRTDVRLADQRAMPWSPAYRSRAAGPNIPGYGPEDVNAYAIDERTAFILDRVLPAVQRFVPRPEPSDLVVNVRRGDYYSDPSHRGAYAFDVDAYLRCALPLAVDKPVERIRVVSDGIDWCRARLGWLQDYAEDVSFADQGDGPMADFVEICSAQRLVITNSTFSYWGAYVAEVVTDGEVRVVAPDFFDRTQANGRSTLHASTWTLVADIPGGWDS